MSGSGPDARPTPPDAARRRPTPPRSPAPRPPPRKLEADLAPAFGVAVDQRPYQGQRGHLVVEGEPPAAPFDAAAVRLDLPSVAVLPEVDISPCRVGEPAVPPVSASAHRSI